MCQYESHEVMAATGLFCQQQLCFVLDHKQIVHACILKQQSQKGRERDTDREEEEGGGLTSSIEIISEA